MPPGDLTQLGIEVPRSDLGFTEDAEKVRQRRVGDAERSAEHIIVVKQIGRNGAPAQYPAQAMKKVRYPAEISRPVILARSKGFAVPDPNTTSGRKKIQEANKEMMRLHDEAIVQKLHLLMDHYKINKKDWFALARALAFDHVDG